MHDERCEDVRDAIAELALGIASGDDRARVLEHARGCADCQRMLDELAAVGDELLRVAPRREPPAGFEVRVLDRIGVPRPGAGRLARLLGSGRRRPVALAAAAAALAAGAAATVVTLRSTSDERRLGAQLSTVFEHANGRYFGAEPLRDRDGRDVGRAFVYGGATPWVLVALERPLPAGDYRATAVTRAGARIDLGSQPLEAGERTLSTTVGLDLREVAVLLLRGPRGAVYAARLPPPEG